MEFTYDGLVRYGFGFYNPNHAAAFVCALLPYVWLLLLQSAIWKKLLGAVLTAALTVALAFTYSRAGLLVFSLEAIAFVAFCGRKYWEWFLGVGVMLMLAIFIANGFGTAELRRCGVKPFGYMECGTCAICRQSHGGRAWKFRRDCFRLLFA